MITSFNDLFATLKAKGIRKRMIAGSVGWSIFNWTRLLFKAVIPVYAVTCSVGELFFF